MRLQRMHLSYNCAAITIPARTLFWLEAYHTILRTGSSCRGCAIAHRPPIYEASAIDARRQRHLCSCLPSYSSRLPHMLACGVHPLAASGCLPCTQQAWGHQGEISLSKAKEAAPKASICFFQWWPNPFQVTNSIIPTTFHTSSTAAASTSSPIFTALKISTFLALPVFMLENAASAPTHASMCMHTCTHTHTHKHACAHVHAHACPCRNGFLCWLGNPCWSLYLSASSS